MCSAAGAQELRTLHVELIRMRADRAIVLLRTTFHLTIHARVRERVSALDELVVPEVGSMHLLGDERHVSHTPAGTEVDETLTLEPVEAGTITIPGAFLDATDARTGKPTRFTANPVRVIVRAAGPSSGLDWVRGIGIVVLGALIAAMGALLATRVIGRRRPVRPPAVVAAPAAVAPLAASPREAVRGALAAFRNAPSNGALANLRGALFAATGSRSGATARDAVAATSDQHLRAAVRAADTATFAAPDARRVAADALIDSAQMWLG